MTAIRRRSCKDFKSRQALSQLQTKAIYHIYVFDDPTTTRYHPRPHSIASMQEVEPDLASIFSLLLDLPFL